tara:strand:- start:70 stop:261 length:192 start_codon:yes stop_codon:yes gene_type:complete
MFESAPTDPRAIAAASLCVEASEKSGKRVGKKISLRFLVAKQNLAPSFLGGCGGRRGSMDFSF